ncbi:MAG: PEGA domain-containing protein [Candidatus Aminicenantes bacterium]|nr:PEGA domain-containing protein [Candidatus Aminicenantes bacterium]
MERKTVGYIIIFLFLLLSVYPSSAAAEIFLKVTVDNASINESALIGSRAVVKVSLDTVLMAETKEAEWYRVFIDMEGIKISGYIHEMLVEEISAEEAVSLRTEGAAAGDPTTAELAAGIILRLEEGRALIRQKKDYDKVLDMLHPLIPRIFNITDNKRQKELAAEVYLWNGLAYAGLNEGLSALHELRNMWEVDEAYARELTKNILDEEIVVLIGQAEKEYQGVLTEYTLNIVTDPVGAEVLINGNRVGDSPQTCTSSSPQIVLQLKKEGFEDIEETLFLSGINTEKSWRMESIGRNIRLVSNPKGLGVLLDGKSTGLVTDCILPWVEYGSHRVRLEKEHYTSWEQTIDVEKGEGDLSFQPVLTVSRYAHAAFWPRSESLKDPSGMTMDPDGDVYIIDISDRKVKKFSPDGKFNSAWGMGVKELNGLREPAGIAVDQYGNVYITDTRRHTVNKFSKEGKFIRKWGKEGEDENSFKSPAGIAVDAKNNVYVADSGNFRIKKYSVQGDLVKTWGERGNKEGQFSYPRAVAVGPDGMIYVIDQFRVQKFSSEGMVVKIWGKPGKGGSEFTNARGIFVDRDGYVYVADTDNNRIQKFTAEGDWICQFGSPGLADGQISLPIGLAVDGRGRVLVLENGNSRVQVFDVPSKK